MLSFHPGSLGIKPIDGVAPILFFSNRYIRMRKVSLFSGDQHFMSGDHYFYNFRLPKKHLCLEHYRNRFSLCPY